MRISNNLDNFLAFVENFDVPFTNNIAEQTIRSAKIKIKNACYLDEEGTKMYATIYSVLNTAHKQNGTVCGAIKNICSGEEIKFAENV
ncbi:MAG: transposase [Desulfovibrionaceae bacterium]|nr:transposase [Desulfovibrionaceae bacterium]